ncbi:choice-of-anchor D domain-containing protein [Hamadaea tsunoensis]|uniref:choice-of-anchor D domain-containing protein n=1 Tax=Hamadaea tsunoensis TaxID=53368 RepID=UPI000687A6EA|nr:choice-of-anchor D domain-containing protein [Hamadaea tsunoensis]
MTALAAASLAAPAQAEPAVPTLPSQPGTALPLPGNAAGAAVPFTEYQAENARTDGSRLGPDRGYTRLVAEASGRRAVALDAGEYVEFVLAKAANAVDVRYSIADGPDVALAVTVDGRPGPRLNLTAKYSHAYGLYPFGNDPATGGHHHYFDDVRTMFGRTLPAGTRVRLTPAADAVIDLADFEMVAAPGSAPAGALDAAAFGADPTGAADSGAALQSAADAAREQHRPLWIGPGTYRVDRRLQVDDVTVQGAGLWYTVLTGDGVGVFGNAAPTPSNGVHLAGFAVFGTTTGRDDATVDSGFGGALGGGSTISDVWVEHTKVGMWFDGPSSGLTVTGARIQNTWADGINLHDGVSDTTVTQTFVRNTGDDGMAMWSASHADSGNVFSHDTVAVPLLANAYAIYGGRDNAVRDSVAADTVTQGGGVHAGNRFGAVPLAGTTTLSGNLLVRTGSLVPNDPVQIGALWFWAADEPIDATISVRDTAIVDSTMSAVQFYGKSITGVTVDRVAVTGAGTFAVQIQAPGAATFQRVVAVGLGAAGVQACGDGFTLTRGAGDLGWSTTSCGLPLRGQLNVAPADGIDFGFRSLGSTATRPITVTNPGPGPVRITAVHPPAGFTAADTCGVLAAGQSCTITVGFAPRTAANFAGRLSIDSTSPAGPYVVAVAGIGFDPDGNLALGRTATASSSCCFWLPAANLVDGDPATYFETANNAFPQTLSVDLGQAFTVSRIVVKLPGNWGGRTETIAVSADGAPLLAAADYTLDPDTGNVATLSFPATSARTLTLTVTGNTGWPAAQLSEIEVYAR